MSLTVFNRSYLERDRAQENALNIINVLQLKSPTGRMGFSENLANVTYAFALIKNQVRNSEQRKLSLDFLGQNELKMINEDFFSRL